MDIRKELSRLRESGYKTFTSDLVPNVEKERILGIRIPLLRELAGKLKDTEEEEEFMISLPHYYLDENNLHAILISNLKDPETALRRIDEFLPYVDNWETSDIMNPRCLRNTLELTGKYAHSWLEGDTVYQRRYAITTFMKLFLDEEHIDMSAMKEIAEIGDDDYYVRMAAAWYWSESMVKNPGKALPYFENDRIRNPWIRRKAIQKARESFRVPEELKKKLSEMK